MHPPGWHVPGSTMCQTIFTQQGWERSIAGKLTCTTSQERITAITGFPLAEVFLASASARPAGRGGRLGWGTPVGTNRLSHQPGVLSPPGAEEMANTRAQR